MSAAPGEALRPALALVNSRRLEPDGPVDDLDSPAGARAWLAGHGFEATGQVGDGALGAMRELRDAVRELLVARIEARVPAAGAVETVNAAAAAAPMAHRLLWSGSDA